MSEEYQVNNHVDLLLKKSEEQKKRQEQMRQIKEREEMNECSFQPKISADNPNRSKAFGYKRSSMDDINEKSHFSN